MATKNKKWEFVVPPLILCLLQQAPKREKWEERKAQTLTHPPESSHRRHHHHHYRRPPRPSPPQSHRQPSFKIGWSRWWRGRQFGPKTKHMLAAMERRSHSVQTKRNEGRERLLGAQRKSFKRKGLASKTAVRIFHLKIMSSTAAWAPSTAAISSGTAAPYYNSLDLISYFLSI